MTKRICIVLCLLFLYHHSSCQDTLRATEKKFQLSLNAGTCFKGFFGRRYIQPSQYSYDDPYQAHQFDRFTKIPAFGFSAGFLFSFKLSKHWGISTGLSYFFRKTIYENSQDTVIKYAYAASMHNIQNTVKYHYSYNNLEWPLLVRYRVGKVTMYAGFDLSLLSFREATYTYMMNQYPQDPGWYTSPKTIKGFETAFRIYPTVQISYDWKIKNVLIQPFIGLEIFEINMKEFYLHIQTSPGFYIFTNGPRVEKCYFLQAGVIFPFSIFNLQLFDL